MDVLAGLPYTNLHYLEISRQDIPDSGFALPTPWWDEIFPRTTRRPADRKTRGAIHLSSVSSKSGDPFRRNEVPVSSLFFSQVGCHDPFVRRFLGPRESLRTPAPLRTCGDVERRKLPGPLTRQGQRLSGRQPRCLSEVHGKVAARITYIYVPGPSRAL